MNVPVPVKHLTFLPNFQKQKADSMIFCTRCDGNQPCSTCLKKEIDCIYRQQDGSDQANESVSPQQHGGSPGLSDPMSVVNESLTAAAPESSTTGHVPSVSSMVNLHTSISSSRDPLATAASSLSLHGRELEGAMITMPPPSE